MVEAPIGIPLPIMQFAARQTYTFPPCPAPVEVALIATEKLVLPVEVATIRVEVAPEQLVKLLVTPENDGSSPTLPNVGVSAPLPQNTKATTKMPRTAITY